MSTLLDTGIALAMVFFLLSLLVSGVQESIASIFNSRGKVLERAVIQLLTGYFVEQTGVWPRIKDSFRTKSLVTSPAALSTAVLSHGLLDGLYQGDRLPSYVPAEKFADALIDVLRRETGEQTPSIDGLLYVVRRVPNGKPKEALETMLLASGKDIARFRAQVIDWYNSTMDRVSGWYTRTVRYRTFLIGLILAAAMQIDAIKITVEVSNNASLRASLVSAAEATRTGDAGADTRAANARQQLDSFNLPIGWSWCDVKPQHDECQQIEAKAATDSKSLSASEKAALSKFESVDWSWNYRGILLMLIGWLITALAVSQGAPFWFKLINQLVSIRGAGGKPKDQKKAAATSSGAALAPAPWSGNAEPAVPLGMTADDVRNVQRKLGVPITAVVDDRTRDAVRGFQTTQHGPPNGTLDLEIARTILATP